MINEALGHLRSRNNFHLVASSHAEQLEGEEMTPIAQMSEEHIYQLIAQLPEGYRTVFNLFVIEGFSHQEISEQLQISQGTSKSQLSKAKAMLRDMVNKNDLRYGS